MIKDRRFTRDKFFFHCPITLNFKAGNAGRFNDSVNKYLSNNPAVNVIGIDRGERHLLYYTVVNQKGEIIEQKSFNQITNSYDKDGGEIEVSTDYHSLLDEKEKRRDEARKSWKQIGNIKELKSGYLSHIVHQLAILMIKYNAVIVLEDLNFGFKRGRFKVEKQVYQKFEKALIDKLNYLVFKDSPQGCAGHYMKAYQFTSGFESFKKLGKQSGFLFYVVSNYTSKIDPVSGFVDLLKPKYESVDKSMNFLSKFDRISYNDAAGYFEFAFDYAKFGDKAEGRTQWVACTHGGQRYTFNPKTKQRDCVDVTAELKSLFESEGIGYLGGGDLVEDITKPRSAEFFRTLMRCLSLTLQLRHTGGDDDFILSPVADCEGMFFDSRRAPDWLPQNADANGAYHIALKGLLTLKQINEGGKPGAISNKEWFRFRQEEGIRDKG